MIIKLAMIQCILCDCIVILTKLSHAYAVYIKTYPFNFELHVIIYLTNCYLNIAAIWWVYMMTALKEYMLNVICCPSNKQGSTGKQMCYILSSELIVLMLIVKKLQPISPSIIGCINYQP